MSVDREELLAAFHAAIAACDPEARVAAALATEDIAALMAGRRFGVAVGKAALAMARGVGAVERGVIVVPANDGQPVPPGWTVIESAHPFVDERSVIAARAAREVVDAAGEGDVVLALISGGASALIEEPIDGVTIQELAATTRAVMESGASIEELNTVRSVMSRIKRGGLVARCAAPVVTLAVSDVIGDGLAIIGSGPTIGAWFVDDEASRRERARAAIERAKAITRARIDAVVEAIERARGGEPIAPHVDPPRGSLALRAAVVDERAGVDGVVDERAASSPTVSAAKTGDRPRFPREHDVALVIGRMAQFGESALLTLGHQMWSEHVVEPLGGDVAACADLLVEIVGVSDAQVHGTYVAWGEPTLHVPRDHGEGGRAQQLALHLAKALRGTGLIAMAIGSDGIDGPPPTSRPAPAGAIVDGTTWDAIIASGHDPDAALARCDAGTALSAVGALVVTGPTGVNHGDLVIIGDRRQPKTDHEDDHRTAADLRVRRATELDFSAILVLHRASIIELCSASYSPEEIAQWASSVSIERYAKLHAERRMFVCERAGVIAGFGVLDVMGERIFGLYVSPTAVRGGVGRALLAAMESHARDAGLVRLELDASLNAVAFYERAGYVNQGPTTGRTASGLQLASMKMVKAI